jgi:biopolymer transport protein ExbB/TolQ
MSTALDWYREGGPIMLLIVLVGLAGIAILLERFYVIVVRSRTNGRLFIERVIQLVRGGKIDDAIKMCVGSHAALSDIGLVLLRSRSREEPELQQVANAASLAVTPKLSRRLQYLSVLAVVALLLGALGTLWDLRASLYAAGPDGSPAAHISQGLAAAFNPAILGIAVATILALGRGYLVSQAESIVGQLAEFSVRLINALTDLPDVRLGHR